MEHQNYINADKNWDSSLFRQFFSHVIKPTPNVSALFLLLSYLATGSRNSRLGQLRGGSRWAWPLPCHYPSSIHEKRHANRLPPLFSCQTNSPIMALVGAGPCHNRCSVARMVYHPLPCPDFEHGVARGKIAHAVKTIS